MILWKKIANETSTECNNSFRIDRAKLAIKNSLIIKKIDQIFI